MANFRAGMVAVALGAAATLVNGAIWQRSPISANAKVHLSVGTTVLVAIAMVAAGLASA